MSPGEKYRPRTPLSASDMIPTQEIKKIKKEEKEGAGHQSDGEKSDQDLVVDDACSEDINPLSPMPPNQSGQHQHHHHNGNTSSPPRENGMMAKKMEHPGERIVTPNSPRSSSSDRGSSSNGSTTPSNPNQKVKLEDKPSTPGVTNGNSTSGIPKSIVAKPPASYAPGYMGPMNGGNPHEMQAAYAAAAAAGVPVLPPGHPGYRGVPGLPMGFDAHPQMRAPPIGPGALSAMAGGKP